VAGLNIQVTIIEDQLGELYIKLEKAQKLIKQLRNGIIKPNTAIPTKKKGKQATILKPVLINGLDLLPLFEDCPIITVPISAIAYTVLPDYIIDIGIGIMRVTDTEDWPERTRNWVVLAESRLYFDFK
jgi:hypothetical protein